MIYDKLKSPGFYGTPQGGARVSAYKRFDHMGKTLMPGGFTPPEQIKMPAGCPTRLAAWGLAGAHIAELIKTMLDKKASGIDLARGVSA